MNKIETMHDTCEKTYNILITAITTYTSNGLLDKAEIYLHIAKMLREFIDDEFRYMKADYTNESFLSPLDDIDD